MESLLVLFLFFFGTVWGSFLNVVIYRTISGESFVKGRSRCGSCKKIISWWQNIPLFSYFFLQGRCFYCKAKISWQYPIVEAITGILFVWWYVVGRGFFVLAGSPWQLVQPVFWLLVGVSFLVIFVFDLRFGIIPDGLSLFLGGLALFYRFGLVVGGQMRWEDFFNAIISAVLLFAFFYFLWWFTKGRGFGFGDVKLSPALGLILGWPRILVAVFVAFVLGGMVAVFLLIFGKKKFGQSIPFGPFLVIGVFLALLWGEKLAYLLFRI